MWLSANFTLCWRKAAVQILPYPGWASAFSTCAPFTHFPPIMCLQLTLLTLRHPGFLNLRSTSQKEWWLKERYFSPYVHFECSARKVIKSKAGLASKTNPIHFWNTCTYTSPLNITLQQTWPGAHFGKEGQMRLTSLSDQKHRDPQVKQNRLLAARVTLKLNVTTFPSRLYCELLHTRRDSRRCRWLTCSPESSASCRGQAFVPSTGIRTARGSSPGSWSYPCSPPLRWSPEGNSPSCRPGPPGELEEAASGAAAGCGRPGISAHRERRTASTHVETVPAAVMETFSRLSSQVLQQRQQQRSGAHNFPESIKGYYARIRLERVKFLKCQIKKDYDQTVICGHLVFH